MSISIQMPTQLSQLLIDAGFKTNGNDYYKSYPVTNFKNEWDEEVYVSKKNTGDFEVFFPENEKKNKVYKSEKWLINFLDSSGFIQF